MTQSRAERARTRTHTHAHVSVFNGTHTGTHLHSEYADVQCNGDNHQAVASALFFSQLAKLIFS